MICRLMEIVCSKESCVASTMHTEDRQSKCREGSAFCIEAFMVRGCDAVLRGKHSVTPNLEGTPCLLSGH